MVAAVLGGLRTGARLLIFLALLLLAFAVATLLRLAGPRRLRPAWGAGWWSRRALALLGIRVQRHGPRSRGRRMLICNHVSWLDILVLAAAEEPHFIAKSEIRHWPLVGYLANSVGTFYIRRGRGGATPLLTALVPWLRAGEASFVVFPEGTTTDGRDVLPMHPRLFEAAVAAGVPVQPLALRYRPDARGRDIAPFIGADTLAAHIGRVLASPGLTVELHYGALQTPRQPRDVLAWRAETEVRRCLGLAARAAPSSVPVAAPAPAAAPAAEAAAA